MEKKAELTLKDIQNAIGRVGYVGRDPQTGIPVATFSLDMSKPLAKELILDYFTQASVASKGGKK